MPPEIPDPSIPETSAAQPEVPARLHLDAGLVFFLALTLGVFVAVHQYMNERFDFGVFYYAAHMVIDGARHQLYLVDVQHVFQARFHRPPAMLFRNPPFALLPLLPIALLPMLAAYATWTAISFGLLYVNLKFLEIETGLYFANWPLMLCLAYVPVMASLLHGQLSLLVLLAFVLCYTLWNRGLPFFAGVVLALATLKVQLVAGFVVVLILRGKWRVIGGFLVGCVLLFAISVCISGLAPVLAYPQFLLHGEGSYANEFASMANIHGLLYLLHIDYSWIEGLVSAIAILWAARAWRDLDHGFAAAMILTLLVSYHFNPQDLSLSILPFYLSAKIGLAPRSRIPAIVATCLLVTMLMVTTYTPLSPLSLPLALGLWLIGKDALHPRTPNAKTHTLSADPA